MNVRLADRVNLPALVVLAHAMHDEAPNLRAVPLDMPRTVALLGKLVEAGTAIVAQDAGGGLCGFLLFHVYDDPWTGEATAGELALYVAPGSRGQMLANQLIGAAEARALYLGAVQFRAGTTAGTATSAARAVYARAGWQEEGYCFRKRLVPLDTGRVNGNVESDPRSSPP